MTTPTQSPLESLIFHTLETLTAQERLLAQHYSQSDAGMHPEALVGQIVNLRSRADRLSRMMDAMDGMYTRDLSSSFKSAFATP